MVIGLETIVLLGVIAGYGDVDSEGYPSWSDRDLHLWTNAARVDPEAFEAEYELGGCSLDVFTQDERTPKAPVYYDASLNEAARYHSDDMVDNNCFQHNSCDGTDWAERIMRYYDEGQSFGENIAYGYGGGWNTIFYGWMCSESGHRENIMSSGWNELGTGVNGTHMTQDFASGSTESDAPIRMGLHSPQSPSTSVEFFADWGDTDPPVAFEVVLNGVSHTLAVEWGDEENGVFAQTLSIADEAICHEYYFYWESTDGLSGTFPEEGSYQFGTGCDALMWRDGQLGGGNGAGLDNPGDLLTDITLVGCAVSGRVPPSRLLLLAALGLLLAPTRRNRLP